MATMALVLVDHVCIERPCQNQDWQVLTFLTTKQEKIGLNSKTDTIRSRCAHAAATARGHGELYRKSRHNKQCGQATHIAIADGTGDLGL